MSEAGDLLEPAQYGPEVDREASIAPRSMAIALLTGGVISLASGLQRSDLSHRERGFALGGAVSCLGMGAVALGGPLSLNGPARRAPVPFSIGCYTAASTSSALGGGHDTPAYFSSILLTALGGGIGGDRRTAVRGGVGVAVIYLAGCVASLKPWRRPVGHEAWWDVAGACGFIGAGIAGAVAGDLTLKTRALTDFVERESEGPGRQRIDEAARQVRTIGRRIEGLLRRARDEYGQNPQVREATDALATALASLETAAIAEPEDAQQMLGTWGRLGEIADRHNRRDGDVQVTLESPDRRRPSTDAATTSALCRCATVLIQNSANARAEDGPPVQSHLRLEVISGFGALPFRRRDRRATLRLTVEDDAGGSPPPEAAWGGGLTRCREAVDQLGGRMWLEPGQAGLRVVLEVPYIKGRVRGSQALTFARQAEEGRDEVLRALRHVTSVQALFVLLSTTEKDRLPTRGAVVAALLALGEVTQRADPHRRPSLCAALGAAGMSALSGPGRPPVGGWSAVMCAQATSSLSRGAIAAGWAAAIAGTLGATAVAGPERFGAALPVTIADRTFSLLGAAVGHAASYGIRRIQHQEEEVAGEAWRRQTLRELSTTDERFHDFLKPLHVALGDERWGDFRDSRIGRELRSLSERGLGGAQSQLGDLLRDGDPLRDLQHQLARLLAPARVRVLGQLPDRTQPGYGHELEALRFRLGLIGLGQAIAQRVRSYLPESLLFREPLQELQVHVEQGPTTTRFTIVQVPYRAPRRDQVDAILDATSSRAGGKAEPAGEDRFSVTVDNWALG